MDKDKTAEAARDFLGAWQQQWGALMTHPDTVTAMLNLLRQMQSMGAPAYEGSASFSQPSWPAMGAVGTDVAALAARLALCEGRIAQLEAQLASRNNAGL
jgi:hypothetical protein